MARSAASAVSMATRDDALATLAERVAGRGFAIAYDLLGNRAEAEDAVQEALARACAGYARMREPAALEGWFYRVLTNHCLRLLRRRRLRRALATVLPERVAPDLRRGRLEDAPALLVAIEALPPKQRAAVVLRYGHELPLDEIAAMLDVGRGTVKTHLTRALRALRAELGGPS